MNLEVLKSKLSSNIDPVLSHYGKNKLASVLVLIYGDEPNILMTEKPKHLTLHPGEISFPGGKYESSDNDLLETALRETREEIGLNISRNQVLGQLKPVTTLNSSFMILPFISILDKVTSLSANSEVEKILHIPLVPFLKTMSNDPNPIHNLIEEMYTFEYQDKIIWGASARILRQIASRINLRFI